MRDMTQNCAQTAVPSTAASLAVNGLGYNIDGHRLLQDVSFDIRTQGITVLMGPNGAGKSVLLRLLHGILPPSDGQVHWYGKPLSPEITRQQALVFQKPVLLRRSVAANVDFVLRTRGRQDPGRRDAALARVGLLHLVQHPARRLSGGEQQRLALARALATEPDVLLLDEPTANLDPAAVQLIENIVTEAASGGTKVFFVTHDIGQARRLAEDVVFLHRGRLLEHSAASAFFDAPQSSAARAYLAGEILT